MNKASLSWLLKVEKEMKEVSGCDTEIADVLRGSHKILKLSNPVWDLKQLEGVLNMSYKFGLGGNGLSYKLNKAADSIWVYSWDLKIDRKWHMIWAVNRGERVCADI